MTSLLFARRFLKRSGLPGWATFGLQPRIQRSFELKKTLSVSAAIAAPSAKKPSEAGVNNPKSVPLEFSDKAYKDRPTRELLRAYFVYSMFAYESLVNKSDTLISRSRKLLGRWLFQKMMRATVYGQFVAGENLEELRPVMDQMRKKGIRSILDYAVEEDVGQGSKKISAREYFYDGQEGCERNMQKFMDCIEVAAEASGGAKDAFAAIKLTALGNTQLLKHRTREIRVRLWLFKELADQPSLTKGVLSAASLHTGLNKHLTVPENLVDSMFKEIDAGKSGKVGLLQWEDIFQPQTMLYDYISKHAKEMRMPGYLSPLSNQENDEWCRMQVMTEKLADLARDRSVRLLVDAEQTYFQLAIRDIAVNILMPKYNKEKPVIYNTQQCYLKSVDEMVELDLFTATNKGFMYGLKLVRGAYMEQERERAQKKDYMDPVCDSKEETDKQYHQMLERLLAVVTKSELKYELLVASHNEESVKRAVKLMEEMGISKDSGSVAFGQLLGMCDHVSLTLGEAGYHIYKYMPYGPVEEVLPYLVRRANENKGILEGAVRERKLLAAELKRRLLPKFLQK